MNSTLKLSRLFLSCRMILLALPMVSMPALAKNLTLYTTGWSEYSNPEQTYSAYEYDGAYKTNRPYGQLETVSNPDMVAQFQKADVIPYSFMQVWNTNDPNQAMYNVPAEWNGLMHFSDLWGELPFEAEWISWERLPSQAKMFYDFCNNAGVGTCSSVQRNGNTSQMELFKYTDRLGVGQLNSFGAFITSNKFGNAKRIISVGGANTPDNHSISAYTFDAIFANQAKFLSQFQRWMQAFPNLKGIDYDFEPPINSHGGQLPPDERTLSDYKKLYELVKATRAGLGNDAYIAVTITSNLQYLDFINRSVEGGWFNKISTYVNAVNLMTYDFHGPWSHTEDPYTSIHAYVKQPNSVHKDAFAINYAAEEVVNKVLSYGIAPSKLQIGIATYGRGFSGVPAGGNSALPGFEQSWVGSSQFAGKYTNQTGLVPYKAIPKIMNELNYQKYHIMANDGQSDYVTGSYIYSAQAQQFVGYQSPETVKSVCELVKAKGLQGAILWSADTDLPVSDNDSLVGTFKRYCAE